MAEYENKALGWDEEVEMGEGGDFILLPPGDYDFTADCSDRAGVTQDTVDGRCSYFVEDGGTGTDLQFCRCRRSHGFRPVSYTHLGQKIVFPQEVYRFEIDSVTEYWSVQLRSEEHTSELQSRQYR